MVIRLILLTLLIVSFTNTPAHVSTQGVIKGAGNMNCRQFLGTEAERTGVEVMQGRVCQVVEKSERVISQPLIGI